MMKSSFTLIFACFFTCWIHAFGQTSTDSLARFVRNIQVYNQLFPREQVYLHFDNTGYFMGETIWFKAYVVNPQGFKPTGLSRVLYAELLTPEGRVLQTLKLKIEDGQCHGCFSLADLLHAGFYEVRAYTALMLNWEDAPVFSRVFPIFNAPKKEGEYDKPRMIKMSHTERLPEMREEREDSKNVKLTFFPEGGDLVEGLSSTIAFKVTDKWGNPLEAKGRICNNKGETAGNLQTQHDGMGRFVLQPNGGERYHAEIMVEEDGKPLQFELPASLRQGYVMNVNNLRDDNLVVQLKRNGLTDTTRAIGMTILCRGEVVMFKPIEWKGQNTALLNVPKKQLPEGVNLLTLFDTEGRIHAERLVFISASPEKNISLVGEKIEALKPRQKVDLNFKVKDNTGKPVSTTFSLSVRDANTMTPTNNVYGGGTMATNLLLGSELKGYIHHIDYYLESDDRTHRLHLDLLLCTQGWRKYEWKELTRPEEFKVTYPIEEGIMVHGNLTSTFRKRAKEGVEMKVYLFNEAGDKRIGTAVTDSVGKFAFLAEDFTGRWQMNIMTYEDGKPKEMNVNLKKVKSPQGRTYENRETELHLQEMSEVTLVQPDTVIEYEAEEKHRWENLLPTVKVEGQKEWQSEFVRKWNNIIYDMEDERMRMDETGEEYLEEYWDWLLKTNPYFGYTTIKKRKEGNITSTQTRSIIPTDSFIGDSIVPSYKSRPIKFLISRVGTGGWLLTPGTESVQEHAILLEDLTINDVEAITICDKPDARIVFQEGTQGNHTGSYMQDPMLDPLNTMSHNYVYVTLFVRNDYFRYKDKRGHRKTKIQGFTPQRMFYMPDYSYADLPDEQDFRRTLYWNPNVKTNADGEATVTFYNTPTCRNINISAETITAEGKLGAL
ncbi:MAG: hypothetical protein IJ467_00060 [Bacteroidaceae bacterium]|nr:hypothetical protein [Bacteroidaceae bacterium]